MEEQTEQAVPIEGASGENNPTPRKSDGYSGNVAPRRSNQGGGQTFDLRKSHEIMSETIPNSGMTTNYNTMSYSWN